MRLEVDSFEIQFLTSVPDRSPDHVVTRPARFLFDDIPVQLPVQMTVQFDRDALERFLSLAEPQSDHFSPR